MRFAALTASYESCTPKVRCCPGAAGNFAPRPPLVMGSTTGGRGMGKRAAGMVVLRRIGGDWRCLLLRVYRNWDFPKGLIEEGEDPWAAALREVAEETSLTGLRFPFGREGRDTESYAHGKIARYFLAEAPAGAVHLPVSPELGRPEHHEFRWTGWDEARGLLPARLTPVLDWARATAEAQEAAR